jgi:hypothetical protein
VPNPRDINTVGCDAACAIARSMKTVDTAGEAIRHGHVATWMR